MFDSFVGYAPEVKIQPTPDKRVWQNVDDIKAKISLTVDDEIIRKNIKKNVEDGWTLLAPHYPQDKEVMLLGGGPSLNDFEDDIRLKRESGVPLVTTNGSYHWAIDRGLKPSAQVIVDAQPFMRRFLDPVIPECKYLIASQCDPEAISHLPKDRTYLWHSLSDEEAIKYIMEFQKDPVWPTPGGSTVMLRSIMLLQTIGWFKIHVYGMDSCLDDRHHAYDQKENDKDVETAYVVRTQTKEFRCAPWMVLQAKEFRQMAELVSDELELEVYGDGLISTLIREAAAM